jgi:two-component system response regulator DesR
MADSGRPPLTRAPPTAYGVCMSKTTTHREGAAGFMLKDAPASELASALFLSAGTVRDHLSAAMQKLDARNRAEAIRVAEERGWL